MEFLLCRLIVYKNIKFINKYRYKYISKYMPRIEFKRKLYKRGSSYETTIPMPLLFALDKSKKYNVVFSYDNMNNKWYIKFEEIRKGTMVDKLKE